MTDHRGPGRPRDPETDRAILRATVELIAEVGMQGLTVSAVAARAGVARATVYLRWPNRAALMGAATKAVVGGAPMTTVGDIETDYRNMGSFIGTIFAAPYFAAIFPEMVRAVLSPGSGVPFLALAPNRATLAAQYAAEAASQGFDPGADPAVGTDLMLGFAINRLLATGAGPTQAEMRQAAEVVIAGLRARGTSAET